MQSLKWSVISFTEKGAELAEKIKRLSKEQQLPCEIHTYHGRKQVENLNAWTKEQFSLRNVILFIGACGIAVRTIAPFLKDKLTDSPVLVLDEATSSIDTRTEKHIEHGMDRLMAGKTTFVIAHRLSTVRESNAIMVLEDGRIIERGDHNALVAQQGRYYQLCTGKAKLS